MTKKITIVITSIIIGALFVAFINCSSVMDMRNPQMAVQGRSEVLNKNYIMQTIRTAPWSAPELKIKTYHGCELVPWKGKKPQIEGMEFTNKPCSITVNSDQTVKVSFIDGGIGVLVLLERDSDTLVKDISDNEVLLVQYRFDKIVSVTQTDYDDNGNLNYANNGAGDFIKSCLFIDENHPCKF